ncbi:MAG: AAA family ATPase [Desulfobacteraceae bacterium]|nr:AAA family ATPase [Desulfobacteraceae bacterium]
MKNNIDRNPVIIAVCGKGGVGKTSVSALIVKMLIKDPARRVLAVDADPAVGLAHSLGITIAKSVDQIRRELIARLGNLAGMNKQELIRQLDYDLFSCLTEKENLAFLAIGRPEGDGCFCQVNALLRDLIQEMAGQFDAVVIDGEAGLEQIQRRVMDKITHLLVVSDTSLKSRSVAQTVFEMGQELCGRPATGIIFNRVKDEPERKEILEKNSLPLIHVMAESDDIRQFDRQGRTLLDLSWSEELKQLGMAVLRFVGMAKESF